MAGTIRNLEIFGAGTWNASTGKVTITEGNLDEIVSSFSALQGTNIVKPHLKLGHNDAQKWFGQKDGVPTLGWIDRVWRHGKKLLADVSNVPDALIEMIKAGRFHNVSAELFPPGAIEKDGTKFGHVLSAVAVLGTEMPAVKDLAGLASALFAEQFSSSSAAKPIAVNYQETSMFTQEQVDSLISAAVQKAVGDTSAKFSDQVKDLSAQITVLTSRAETAEGALIKAQDDAANADAIRIVDDAIKAGKLLPKQKDFALAFMTGIKGPVKFGTGEKTPAKLFQEFLEASGSQVDTKERGNGNGGNEVGKFASPAQEVDHKVGQVRAKDSKISYSDAMQAVFAADPDLKDRYAAAQV